MIIITAPNNWPLLLLLYYYYFLRCCFLSSRLHARLRLWHLWPHLTLTRTLAVRAHCALFLDGKAEAQKGFMPNVTQSLIPSCSQPGNGAKDTSGADMLSWGKTWTERRRCLGEGHSCGRLLHLHLVWPWAWGPCCCWAKRIYTIKFSPCEKGMVENLDMFLSQCVKDWLCTQPPADCVGSGSKVLGWVLRVCISTQLPSDTGAGGPRTTLWVSRG